MAKKIAETPLMKQYLELKGKHPDAILLFRVGDFYETFSDDAIAAAEILGITLTRRANGSAMHVELAGFPHHALDSYLPKLVRAGRRVAICDQLEDPKLTKKLVKRGITELVTPGVVLGDNVLRSKENNYLAALYLPSGEEGPGSIAFLDISTGEFVVSEGSPEHLEKLLSSYQPKEVLVERSTRSLLDRLFSYRGFVFEVEDWSFAVENNRRKLTTHFGLQNLKGLGLEQRPASIAVAGAILNYLELTSHTELGHITTLRSIDRLSYMRLDSFTLRSLEILAPMNREEGKSLLDIIDCTETAMGGRLLRHWLSFPLIDLGEIHRRQRIVGDLVRGHELRRTFTELLLGIGDLERLASKAAVGRISPREVRQLAVSLRQINQLGALASSSDSADLAQIATRLAPTEELISDIEHTLTEEPPSALGRGATIAPGISPELDELRQLSTHGKDYLLQLQRRESERTGISSLKVAFNNVFGYYVEVRSTHKDKVPEDWTRKQTLVNAERYIFPELKEYEEKILGAEERIASLESRLYAELLVRLSRFIRALQQNARLIAEVDCLTALSEVAVRDRYACPVVDDGLIIDIRSGRHPVIEQQLPFGQTYVPNDVHLDEDETQIMVITGPNMSGKSALLRQTALIVLLAQIGSFVPAEAAHLGLTDGIFTRVGASDNISRGESTFMVEMQEASSILNALTPRSLVLFDELGRGTSTYDGISIAWAIIEYLHDNPHGRPKTLFATHYHELNDLEARLPRVKNYNVSAREIEGKMLFLRKLVRGGSEHSFGIQVARLGGMPQSITTRASEILAQLESAHIHEVTGLGAEVQVSRAPSPDTLPTEQISTGVQMSFFQLDDPVLSDIRERLLSVQIDSLTPLEALNKLSEIQHLLKTP
ncbi:DNA mismatch repair protein MutS [Porphyromonas sp. oral taxon 278 str. W7784]|uniref:DNA mismatch repair protein MutS n=1 Tax=Porphyromonas sp. oral taxon 278 TaxID=712437 RepID=UPI0003AD5157|nr:DNA mismatch repair protein MutS [Porphyromonas sp. oral taxon 278]ERJ71564.1 DNA mismatch repair protein MutS [Porphyromonas sp. oral taxon 278 str. W7784]